MKLNVYSFFDKKVGVHSMPMLYPHEGYFLRTVKEIVADPNTQIGRHPADFDLHFLGTFDDNTAVFDQSLGIKSLGSAVAFLPARADTLPIFEQPQDQHPLMGVN